MCGISGGFKFSSRSQNLIEQIKHINKLQSSRGPDGSDLWISKNRNLVLGHSRLSIIDLTDNAKQPFVSSDGRYVITFNGEIYNYKILKKELKKKNIIFKSNSDTEVIIESYKEWGFDCFQKFRGMFSFALWDSKENIIILARDPFGIKPLYYCNKNGVFYFASQIKSLLSLEGISQTKEKESIFNFYLWGNVLDPNTIYKDIKSLERGSYKIINKDGNTKDFKYESLKKTLLEEKYEIFENRNDANNYLDKILKETVNLHHVADVPTQILLSSGVDSNTILASTSEYEKKNTSSLTIDFGKTDESFIAAESSKINKINHFNKRVSDEEIKELLKSFFKKMDSPSNDGFNNYVASYAASLNKKKILLSGIGGDEMFGGYPSFSRIPKIIKYSKFIQKVIPQNDLLIGYLRKILKRFKSNIKISGLAKYGKSIETSFLLQRSLFLPEEIEEIFNLDENIKNFTNMQIEKLNNDVLGFKNERFAIMYLEMKYYLCPKLLRDADWTSMAHSIEMRTPFVDWFFFKKLLNIFKSNILLNKKDLLNCNSKKLPKEIYNRRKTGFGIPHKNILNMLNYGKTTYSQHIKDWSIETLTQYSKNEKN